MDNLNSDTTEGRNQELDQLEQAAKEDGRRVKEDLLLNEKEMSEDALISFATPLAQMYLQKRIPHVSTDNTAHYMQQYVRFFRVGYKEAKRRITGKVSYSNRIY